MKVLICIYNQFFEQSFFRRAFIGSLFCYLFVISFTTTFGNLTEPSQFIRVDFIPKNNTNDTLKDYGKYLMSFNGNVKATISKDKSIPLFYMDILNSKVMVSPFSLKFTHGPVKVIRLNQVSEKPAVVRATFFLVKKLQPHVRQLGKSLEVNFTNAPKTKKTSSSYSLINPDPKKKKKIAKKELAINVKDANPKHLFLELARQARRSVHFRDILPDTMEVNIIAHSPIEAMRKIAEQLNLSLTNEEDDIWISSNSNPLLKLPKTDTVDGVDLSKLNLGDILRALGQIAKLNIILDSSMNEVKNRQVQMYIEKMSIRRAFETLLKVNSLTIKEIDNKSMLVTTNTKAREMTGKVLRVVSTNIAADRLIELAKKAMPLEYNNRLEISEDTGNIILIGDKDAVDNSQLVIQSIENKIIDTGESITRAIFHPTNTKSDEITALLQDTMGEKNKIKISVDKRTDRLILSGSRDQVTKALRILKEIDAPATKQALIHIRLIEVSTTALNQIGMKLPSQIGTMSDVSNFKTANFVLPATFEAFLESSKVKTLANPTIRCMDKEEATIDISEQIPIKETVTEYLPVASSSLAARTSDNWTTSDIGIKLNVQPFIHKNNEITMKVDIDLTELIKLVEGHPWTAKRLVKTKVRVKHKETVVIGGLIRRKKNKTKRHIPILSKLPLIGRLFRRLEHRDQNDEKTEMIILITPTVVGPKGKIGSTAMLGFNNAPTKISN